MNRIREYAKKVGHEVVGKLTRHPELERKLDSFTLEEVRTEERFYMDEAKNEYWVGPKGVCIVTADGGAI